MRSFRPEVCVAEIPWARSRVAHPAEVLGLEEAKATELAKPFPVASDLHQASIGNGHVGWDPGLVLYLLSIPRSPVMTTSRGAASEKALEAPCDDPEQGLKGVVALTTALAELGLLQHEQRVPLMRQLVRGTRETVDETCDD